MRRDWFAALWFLAPLLWLFRRALFLGEVFAFRDATHYYFPFYQYIQARWQVGLPLWNPLDGIGQPLLGDPTAAVMYPGKLAFLLPLPFAHCFAVYVVGHLWLGGYGAYRLSRSYHVQWNGAIVAGLAYALSGHILFHYCNPIYCVGAAWLPWAVLHLTRSLRRTGGWSLGLLLISLSMMVLGGDPQTAYHVLLLGLLYVIVARRGSSQRFWALIKDVGLLGTVGVATLLLCAVQVFPTLEWAQRSDRSLRDGPRSSYEWAADAATSIRAGSEFPSARYLWARTPGESHAGMVYQFSVGPWRWLELAWPNVSGRPFPVHRRWLSGFPGEGRMWTPSLYLGLLPLLLALFRFRLTRASVQTKWWSWVVILSASAAVGGYGIGWIIDEFRFQLDPDDFASTQMLPGLGGLYWLMTVALPGYVGFRYPAKLWTITTLGLAVLAAKGWPAVVVQPSRLVHQSLWLIAISSGLAAMACMPLAISWLSRVPPNHLFGPFDIASARTALVISFLHTVLVAASIVWPLRRMGKSQITWAFVVLVTLELAMAQAGIVQTVEPALARGKLPLAKGATMYRCEPMRAYPRRWERTSSVSRLQELQRHDLETLTPKHHLLFGARSVQSATPMKSADYFVLAEFAKNMGTRLESGHGIPNRAWIDLVGAKHVFAPRSDFAWKDQAVTALEDGRIAHTINGRALPRTWLVHEWQILDELSRSDRESIADRTKQVMLNGRNFRDFRRIAIVESSDTLPAPPRSVSAVGDVCEIVEEDEEYIRLSVKTDAPGVLVLADQYYPGWEAYVTRDAAAATPTRMFRVNRVMRGVYLEAGDYQVEFRYRPLSVYAGMVTSLLAWTGLALWMVASLRSRERGSSDLKVE